MPTNVHVNGFSFFRMPSSPILAIPLSLCVQVLTRSARSELRASVGIDDVLVQSPRCHSLAELGDVMRIVQEMNVFVKTCQPLASQSVY